jgi:antitoxin VapB
LSDIAQVARALEEDIIGGDPISGELAREIMLHRREIVVEPVQIDCLAGRNSVRTASCAPPGRRTAVVIFAGRHYYHLVYTGISAMPLNIRNEVVNQLAERLAVRKRINKTDAVRIALENELRRLDEAVPLRDRLRPLQERVLSRPATGLDADKAFYDELGGDNPVGTNSVGTNSAATRDVRRCLCDCRHRDP